LITLPIEMLKKNFCGLIVNKNKVKFMELLILAWANDVQII